MTNITVTPYLVADLLAGDERMSVNVHVIDHRDARILVDTGVRGPHPLAADMEPRGHGLSLTPVKTCNAARRRARTFFDCRARCARLAFSAPAKVH